MPLFFLSGTLNVSSGTDKVARVTGNVSRAFCGPALSWALLLKNQKSCRSPHSWFRKWIGTLSPLRLPLGVCVAGLSGQQVPVLVPVSDGRYPG